ncbi:MAG TPA: suppressor of fused domain protein [Phycisphaerae bacterium]|nr:suppressor of fused domain protein [Phycisphaerae bacterium]
MNDPDWQKWFEDIWTYREETLYKSWLADLGKGIYPLPARTLEQVGFGDPDPRFLTHGVFQCPPSSTHRDWIYISSGMSNAWGDSPETANPNGHSGLGLEFVLHTSEPQQWAIELLHWVMAVQLAVACGRVEGDLLQRNDRVPIGRGIPLKTGPGQITHLLATGPDEAIAAGGARAAPPYPPEFSLETGKVELLLMIGITDRERDFARSQGVEGLVALLRHHNVFPLTQPERASVV